MMNFAYAKNGEVWLRGADDGKDAELCAYIAKRAFYLELCGITNKDDVIEACGAADCFCELGALFAAATQAAELRARLAAYEATGLEPEQCAKYAQAEKEGRYILLKEPGTAGIHRLEEIARADIEGRLVVLPCKVGDTIYEIDLPEYGVIVCKVIWIDYYIGPAAHVQGNEMVAAVSVSVEVIDGHGKGSCYAFEQSDFGKTVFLTREDAEKALGGGTNDKP
jgi:hypothetical protein